MPKMIPISPSSLRMFAQCPFKYEARYIKKLFKVDGTSEPLVYGNLVHKGLEFRLKHSPGFDLLAYFQQEASREGLSHCGSKFKSVVSNTSQLLSNLDRMMASGWAVYVEREVAIDGDGRVCGWWDDRCFMRTKLDALLVSPDESEIIILDWKTGKASSINEFQLDFNGLALVPEYGLRKYAALDFLVDSGEVKKFEIEVDIALPKHVAADSYMQSKQCQVIQKIKDLMEAHVLNKFPAQPGRFCRWCELDSSNCKHKGV